MDPQVPPKVLVNVTSFALCVPVVKNVYVAAPVPLNTKLQAIASDKAPGVTVVAVAVLLVMLTTGVPVIVNPVTVLKFQIVPLPVRTMLLDPNAIVRVFVLELTNRPHVNVLPFRLSVP